MHMAVDPARQGDEACRINHFVSRAKILSKRTDTPFSNAYVTFHNLCTCDDAGTAYDKIESHEAAPPW